MYVYQESLHVFLKLIQDDNLILVDTDRIISINFLMREILPARSYMYSRNYFPLQAAKVYLCGTKFFKAT